MRKLRFYARLAGQSLIKNKKFYFPYLLSCICMSAMFYIMKYLAGNEGLYHLRGTGYVQSILALGCLIIAMFGAIILFYANSFLIKRRKKELGLYNILGMQKKNIACVMFWETLYSAVIGIGGGILAGILFSKLMLLLLCRLLKTQVYFGFEVSIDGITATLGIFLCIFFLNLVMNLRSVSKAQPIEMLRSANTAERQPKTRWPLTVLGIINLGLGYGIAIWAPSPVMALAVFFIAVIFVIIGTYFLFISGSIAVLKIMRRNKKYYYTTKHFTAVSGMLHRMKKNAAGLASICILSTMVLVTVSCTVCLYVGSGDSLRTRYPNNIIVYVDNADETTINRMKEVISETVESSNATLEDITAAQVIDFAVFDTNADMSVLERHENYTADDLGVYLIQLMTKEEYEHETGKTIDLQNGEILTQVFQASAIIPANVTISGVDFKNTVITDYPMNGEVSAYAAQLVCGVVTKEDLHNVYNNIKVKEEQYISEGKRVIGSALTTVIGVDVESESESELNGKIYENLCGVSGDYTDSEGNTKQYMYDRLETECRADNEAEFNTMYGGFFFMGIFLGVMFLMATVLIIYYKQISEGFEDADRFKIMQRVGLSQKEVKATIHSQILTVFFLPLITAGIHILVAFGMLVKLLSIFSLYNVSLFAICCLATYVIFAAGYIFIYITTAKSYYQIVRA